ncbi:MAG: Ig-like domain-containing protein [Gemmataceae bacterium]|nr:Ig-like domain-containing protein [Gemmataceae bacterium]MCI0740607.1 Ig-like domain-containing protein [Gemmataceae bacterium]
MSLLAKLLRAKGKSKRKLPPRRTVLNLERLENRIMPIVGAFAQPAPINPGSDYDGVVHITNPATTPPRTFSGSLFQTGQGRGFGHQILTAAHETNPNQPGLRNVRFDLQRAVGAPVPVTINVPANVAGGAQYQIQHSGFNSAQPATYHNDLALLLLVDQVNPAPDRLLVAPFTAQQYSLYSGNPTEVGQVFTMVGYGDSGVGATGNTVAPGTKRAGQNRFDSNAVPWNAAWTNYLLYDFDRLNDPGGLPNIDPIGMLYANPNPGLGPAEAALAPGDSGGPAFVGANVIAGVLSGFNSPGMPPDINAMVDISFGELGFVTNGSRTIGNPALQGVLNPANPAYHVVLDMQQQVLGASNQFGGLKDTLTITAKSVGANLVLNVSGSGIATLDGDYYSAPRANILSLTIRGSDDLETIKLEGPLALGPTGNGAITIQPRGGGNTVIIGDAVTGNLSDLGGPVTVDDGLGWAPGVNSLIINDVAAQGTQTYTVTTNTVQRNGTPLISYNVIDRLTLNAGTGADEIFVQSTQNGVETTVNGRDGNDNFHIGAQNSLDLIAGYLFVNGDAGTDSLTLNDHGTAVGRTYDVSDFYVDRQGARRITYGSFDTLTLNGAAGGNVAIQVYSTAANTNTTINAGLGNDAINVGSALDATSTLNGIQGPLTINGQGGANTLTIDDRGSPRGQVYNRNRAAGTFQRGTGPTITYTNTPTLTIREANQPPPGGGALGNTIDVLTGAAATQDTILGSDGEDIINLYGPFAANSSVTFDAGLGTDLAVVAGDVVTTPQLQLLNNENFNVSGGTFAPGGSGAAQFVVAGNYTQTANGTLQLDLASPTSDQVVVSGSVTLGGNLVMASLAGFLPSFGNSVLLIDKQSAGAVTGTFAGLPEGASIWIGGITFRISYVGGDGNDVSLTALPNITITDVSAAEGNSGTTNFVFTVNLSASSTQTVTVAYATADGTAGAPVDYSGASAVLTFLPGQISKTITVNVVGDTTQEPDETFYVNLTSPINATLADAQGRGLIVNDDSPANQPPVANDDTASTTENTPVDVAVLANDTDPNGDTLTVVTASPGSHGATTVNPDNTVKYTPSPGFVGSDSFTYQISDGRGGFDTAAVNVTVAAPSLTINDVSQPEGNNGASNFVFTVTLSNSSSQTITVSYSTADGTATAGEDYNAASGSVTFYPGQTTKTIGVVIIGDVVHEPAETFYVNLTNPTNATIADSQGLGTILDDDLLPGGGEEQRFAGKEIAPAPDTVTISEKGLKPFIAEAKARWVAAGFDAKLLGGVRFVVADLPSNYLGYAYRRVIWIDINAAGHGWFIDPTPGDDSEFKKSGPKGVDLLTVVMHELGHIFGYASIDPSILNNNIMTATLGTSERRTPLGFIESQGKAAIDAALAYYVRQRQRLIDLGGDVSNIPATLSLKEVAATFAQILDQLAKLDPFG